MNEFIEFLRRRRRDAQRAFSITANMIFQLIKILIDYYKISARQRINGSRMKYERADANKWRKNERRKRGKCGVR